MNDSNNPQLTQFVYGSVWQQGTIPSACTGPCSNNQFRISIRDARRAIRSQGYSPEDARRIMGGSHPLHSHVWSSARRGYGMLRSFNVTDESIILTVMEYIPYDPAVEGSHRLTDKVEEIVLDRTRLTTTWIRSDFLQLDVSMARHPSKEGIRVNLKRWYPYGMS